MDGEHGYVARVVWEGNTGEGTSGYDRYGRSHRVRVAGKADLEASADPRFRGDASRHNPEDLFLAAVAACHMLTYLALCARQGVRVLSYEDEARGTLRIERDGGGRFEEIVLRPEVTTAAESETSPAMALHQRAHELCFIARSCSVEIRVEPMVRGADAA